MLDLGRETNPFGGLRHQRRKDAIRSRSPDRLLLEAFGPIDRQRHAGPVANDRAADRPAVLPGLSRCALAGIRIARVQPLVAQAEIDAIAPPVAARLRADLDAGTVAAAIRPAVPSNAHFLDAAARREFAARESVHPDIEVGGADKLLQYLRELARIVGERLDLLGGQGARKRFIRRLRDDFDLFLDAGNLEFHAEVRAAAASHDDVRPVDRREPARFDASETGRAAG